MDVTLLPSLAASAGSGLATTAPKTTTSSVDNADRARANKLQNAKDALDMMKSAPKKQKDAAKAHAKAKLDQLREQIKLLKRMAGGNPRLMAKQLAALAKELKEALKEYQGADGGDAGSDASVDAPAAATDDTKTSTNADSDTPTDKDATDSGASDTDTTANTDKQDPVPEQKTDPAPQAQSDAADSAQTSTPPVDAAAPSDARAGTAAYDKTSAQALKMKGLDETDFTGEARGLMKTIKELLQKAKTQMVMAAPAGHGPDKKSQADLDDADKAIADTEKTLQDMEKQASNDTLVGGLLVSVTA